MLITKRRSKPAAGHAHESDSRAAHRTFDFGHGQVRAARHVNPDGSQGGWVADSAHVDMDTYVSPTAAVFGNARVFGACRIEADAAVLDFARVADGARISGSAQVRGTASVTGSVVTNRAVVKDGACVVNGAFVSDDAVVGDRARLSGPATKVGGAAQISGDAWVSGGTLVIGTSVVRGKISDGSIVLGGTIEATDNLAGPAQAPAPVIGRVVQADEPLRGRPVTVSTSA